MSPSAPRSAGSPRSALAGHFLKLAPLYRKSILFSVFTSLLVLGPTVFMLEVYDRVINSRSITTLLMLLLCVLGIYVVMTVLDYLRGKIMYQASEQLDQDLRERLFDLAFESHLKRLAGGNIQLFSDLKTLREFMSSPVILSVMDAPVSLVFLLLVFLINPWLGVLALFGAMVQIIIGFRTEQKTLPVLSEANKSAIQAQNFAAGVMHNAPVIAAMGMLGGIQKRWIAKQREFLVLQAKASDTAGMNSALSKLIQTLQSSLILGASCWLAVKGLLLGGGGMMIVASTLGGRVLAPLAQVIAGWRSVVNARDAYARLDSFLESLADKPERMSLPAPVGKLSVEGIVAAAPGAFTPIIRGVSFNAQPGELIVMTGPSGSGKTTLAKLLVGIWPTSSGKVRLDGADIYTWDKAQLGPYLGYLPQSIELFDGTLAQNIARFADVDRAEVEAVVSRVGLQEFVESLPEGLETQIGANGAFLSGGQRQRVGLARAIYGTPKFLLLDEPNSSLDDAGELALMATLRHLKQCGCTVIVISHRVSVIPASDKLMILKDGQLAAFGPTNEVIAELNQRKMQMQNPQTQNPPAAPPRSLSAS